MATPEAVHFAALLKDLKDRSGRSYGVLAGKLHVSTSTLHRYCNGDAVPNEFAPVERFARVCGASGDELVEVHRRWIVADAARRRPPGGAAAPAVVSVTVPDAVPDAASDATPAVVPEAVEAPEPPEPSDVSEPSELSVSSGGGAAPGSRWSRLSRRTRVLIAAAGVAALLVPTTVVAVDLAGSGKEGGGSAADRVEDAGGGPAAAPEGSASATPRPSGSPSSAHPSASNSASPSGNPSGKPSAGSGAGQAQSGGGDGGTGLGAPPTVSISSYNWEEPCGQHYLVNRGPDELDPPPAPQDRRGWAESYGGVEGGNTRLQLTVQGTSREAVVLKAMNVRVVSRKAPLPWSAYLMGNGCGSGITPQTFASNLDAGHPTLRAVPGTQGDIEVPAVDFPYKVSSEDVEVFNLEMKAVSYDVSWYLELEWSSGGKEGTLRIDDQGKPFRLSGMKGRPEYVHGGPGYGWERAGQP
ncbi:helix-turn-helix domain-containing protein [Streptomyces sp. MBT56]|uniref:transcriptional regulator n=1 Tax=unclassified Streptomyces TaxID=2593676 RepID=UPI0019095DBA|nr:MULTISPECIES: transcriptional regulator [unclassified Streptomyces]MBK3561111.1 helix-turn-helix domain-containing protein [Streptomyces sp. MBT56]MBK3604406.1 helix-turn-helix domain-containing protein [Streptomyces sp. MBT54]MBK3616355.1 helix-turn-helix domain-containing protein [Streptomyces sp. MBT98]MBK6045604.1 helix-turn-helix domain-containing protein [Streptomyces sp. MBT55]